MHVYICTMNNENTINANAHAKGRIAQSTTTTTTHYSNGKGERVEIETKNRPNTTNAKGARTVRMGIGTAAERICMGLARLGHQRNQNYIATHTHTHKVCGCGCLAGSLASQL